jgi:hypothetical protein
MSLPAVNVISRDDWFEPARRVTVPGNATLADIVALAEVPQWILETGEVAINGHIIPRRHWRLVRPKDGMVVTIYPPTLHGGQQGSTKQVITIVATIAIIAGAALISGGTLAPFLGAGFAAGTFGAAAAGAAFGIAGQLALRALAPPPVASNGKNRNFRPEAVAGITGNAIAPFEYLPKVMGTVTASPPFLMQPYSLLVDGTVEVYAIVGLAGYTRINSILINGVPYTEFPDVEVETREGGTSSSSALTLITRMGVERQGEAFSEFDLEQSSSDRTDRLVDQSTPDNSKPVYHLFQTVSEPDEAILRLALPAGYYFQRNDGSTLRAAIPFRIQLKRHGSTTWLNGPEIHISPLDDWAKPLRQHIRLVWGTMSGSASPTSSEATYYVFGYTGSDSFGWSAHSQFRQTGTLKPAKNVQVDRDGVTLYLSGSTFPVDKYDIRIMRGCGYELASFSPSAYEYNGSASNARFFDYFLDSGTYKVKVSQQKLVGAAQIEAFTCIKDTHPIGVRTDLCLIAVKARKTKIESISGSFTSYARTFNGAAWSTGYSATSNPAALYREVLIGSLNAQPLSTSLVDAFGLGDAYLDCQSNGYQANGIIQGYSVEQTLQELAATCRGVPRQEEKWSILLERDTSAESEVQLLSSRIIRNLSVERTFTKVPHAIRAEYLDEDDDFRATETIVYAPGYTSSNATLFQAIRYNLFTDRTKVRERAEFDLAQMIYRKNTYSCEMDWAHLVSGRGTLVALAVDELDSTVGSAVIAEVLTSAGNVTGLRLDAPVTTPTTGAGVTIQLDTGSTLTKQIASVTNSQTILFTTAFADPGTIVAGKIVAVGAFVSTARRCKVFNIERLPNLEARVTLLDEAPEIHA